jgi:hypothetical protein
MNWLKVRSGRELRWPIDQWSKARSDLYWSCHKVLAFTAR